MTEDIKSALGDDVSDCLTQINDAKIEVFDSSTPGKLRRYVRTESDQPIHFTLENPTNANLTFAALDGCLLRLPDQSRCDFFIGNYQKLYFVEIKQVKTKLRSEARVDAVKQLDSSISLLKNKIDLQDTSLIAVICLKAKQVHPLQSAKRVADIVAFKEKHNAELTEGQTHVF
jgi:hypothetical protein